jgi:transposase
VAGVKTALRDLGRRWKQLDDEVRSLNKQIEALVRAAAPELVELRGVGVEVAGQFLVTAGDNADRTRGGPRSPSCAASRHNQPAAGVPAAATDSAVEATEPPTVRCTS